MEKGLNVDLWANNIKNNTLTSYVNIVPTSAHTGEGIPDLLYLLAYLTQTVLAKQVAFSEVCNVCADGSVWQETFVGMGRKIA